MVLGSNCLDPCISTEIAKAKVMRHFYIPPLEDAGRSATPKPDV